MNKDSLTLLTFKSLEEPDSFSSPCFAKCDIHQHAGSSCEQLSTCKGREDTVAAWHDMHCTPGPNWNCTHGLKVQNEGPTMPQKQGSKTSVQAQMTQLLEGCTQECALCRSAVFKLAVAALSKHCACRKGPMCKAVQESVCSVQISSGDSLETLCMQKRTHVQGCTRKSWGLAVSKLALALSGHEV